MVVEWLSPQSCFSPEKKDIFRKFSDERAEGLICESIWGVEAC